jgi:hypothetical protein
MREVFCRSHGKPPNVADIATREVSMRPAARARSAWLIDFCSAAGELKRASANTFCCEHGAAVTVNSTTLLEWLRIAQPPRVKRF